MKTQILDAHSPSAIEAALEVLKEGGLVAFPTDTVYGLGSLAFDGEAVKAIYVAKERPLEKAIPVLLGQTEDLSKVTLNVPLIAERLAKRFWPGPLTLVVPKSPALPESVSASDTVGVRVPDHPAARALLNAAGPMAVTSANRSGRDSPSCAAAVLKQLGGRIDMILDGGETPGGIPSTLVDCTGEKPVILRPGPIGLTQLIAALA